MAVKPRRCLVKAERFPSGLLVRDLWYAVCRCGWRSRPAGTREAALKLIPDHLGFSLFEQTQERPGYNDRAAQARTVELWRS